MTESQIKALADAVAARGEEDEEEKAPACDGDGEGAPDPEPGAGDGDGGEGGGSDPDPSDPPPAGPQPAPVPDDPPAPADDDKKDEEASKAILGAISELKRLRAENAKLRRALANPAFAAAALAPSGVPASGDAAVPRDWNAEYSKLTDPKAKAAFRAAHRRELGL